MGEAKTRREKMTPQERVAEEVSRRLANEGKLIEAGWESLRIIWMPDNAPEVQVRDMRWAFMAGAQHLFASIMTILDEDSEPTNADLKRMDLILRELNRFADEVKLTVEPPKGRA